MWENDSFSVDLTELEGAEHREILADKRLHALLGEVCILCVFVYVFVFVFVCFFVSLLLSFFLSFFLKITYFVLVRV